MIEKLRLFWWRFRETRDQAWQDGYRQAESEWQEAYDEKDVYIAEQGDRIVRLMEVISDAEAWAKIPADLKEELRNYV